jgi:L-Ala-D/L-Glu epimerase
VTEPTLVESIAVEALFVPLREPFVIATARMDSTRAALVTVRLRRGVRVAEGIGEAAPLHPVTREDWPEIEGALRGLNLEGATIDLETLPSLLDAALPDAPVARAGLEAALLDALARLEGLPLYALLSPGPHALSLETDITLPICEPMHMAELARGWSEQGFGVFKVKVGKNLDADVRALRAVAAAVPKARLRLDANEGYTAPEALALLGAIDGLVVECFEQPCKRGDLDGMARLTREAGVPIVADESVRTLADLELVLAQGAASGVNLKLVKHGGLLAALAIGRRARAAGRMLMCGAMVETRLGLVTMGHVVAALGGVDFVDLDTALLLAHDPFEGGWRSEGPRLELERGEGLGVRRHAGVSRRL